MIIENLALSNFRCYERVTLNPDSRFNVFYGANGQGKTSILEAIGLLSFLKSFRNAKNIDLLRNGETQSSISCELLNADLNLKLDIVIHSNRKQARYNGKPCKFLSEYIGKISGVSFSPSDLDIIKGSPENRRNWVDKATQILNLDHLDLLTKYNKVLVHRNRLLKAFSQGQSRQLPEDFEIWTEELANLGSKIIHNRIHTVDNFVDKIKKYYAQISGQKCDITIEYISENIMKVPYGQERLISLELIKRSLTERYFELLPKEKILGITLEGPHRDDLEIKLSQFYARTHASQGEARSLVLALRLSEVEAYKEAQNLTPILLIDDFSSELDASRRSFLLEYLIESPSQVFLTTTEKLAIGKEFLVNEGRISPHGSQYLTDGRQQL